MIVTTEVTKSPLRVAEEWWDQMLAQERIALLKKIREAEELPVPAWRFTDSELVNMSFGDLPDSIALVIIGTVQYQSVPAQLALFLAKSGSPSVN